MNKHNIKNVSLSNNHTFDFNLSGYLQTKKILKERNKSFWSWEKLIRGKKPLVFKNFNDKCAIFGASYKPAATKTTAGVLNLKDEKTCQIIKSFKKKKKKTFLIIYCHSGLELLNFRYFKTN